MIKSQIYIKVYQGENALIKNVSSGIFIIGYDKF